MRVGRCAEFLWLLLAVCFHGGCQEVVTNDVSFINRTDHYCVADDPDNVPGGLIVSQSLMTVDISWEAVTPTALVGSSNNTTYTVAGYEVVYWLASSTVYERKNNSDLEATETMLRLNRLSIFATYMVTVRLYCEGEGEERYGPASTAVPFTTPSTQPSGVVWVVNVETPYEGNERTARFTWAPIRDSEWNGQPYGYYLNLQGPSTHPPEVRIRYPGSEYTATGLNDGVYTVQVIPVNHMFVGRPPSNRTVFRIGEVPSDDDTPFLETPFVYIIVPGIVFIGIILVIAIVLCKKTWERRKRGVSYCRDIGEKHDRIAMQVINPLPPVSPSTGSTRSAPTPTSTGMPRSLPIRPVGSPNYPQDMHEQPLPFGNGFGTNQPARKQPHPGPIPQLAKDHHYPPFAGHAPHGPGTGHTPHGLGTGHVPHGPGISHAPHGPGIGHAPHGLGTSHAPHGPGTGHAPHGPSAGHASRGPGVGGVPMQRSLTNPSVTSSVFTTSAQVHHPTATSPPSGNAHPRRRARTTGGSIPSPYEVPENGSTLPRMDGEGMPRRPNTAHGVSHNRIQMIPPPPSHSPPPLTHSSLELFARMNELGAGPMQNTVPRMQQRSYSTTSADLPSGEAERQRMKQIRSAGNLQSLDEGGEEEKVYIRPLDSSAENSIRSGVRYQSAQDTHHEMMTGAGPSGQATYGGSIVSEYSSISEMTDPSSDPMVMARLPGHPPPLHMNQGQRAAQRESVFSETSTETSLSINSGSIRGTSPPDVSWERRGTSDVGVGQRQRSYSPDRRDGFSDVGASTQQGFRQNWPV